MNAVTLRNENGEYHCPMPVWQREFDEDDNETVTKVLCGEELQVDWTVVTPIPDEGQVIKPNEASEWAVWSRWELRCPRGHVLSTSDNDRGDDTPMAFDPRLMFGGPT